MTYKGYCGVPYYQGTRNSTMKTAQLHPNIRYIALEDKEGDFGILVHHDGSYVYAAVEVDSQDMFREVYGEMMALRGVRDSLANVV